MNLTIKIENLTEAQAEAIEDMMATWEMLGSLGSSRWTAFYADGDGNFRPKIKVNKKKARFSKHLSNEEKWGAIAVKQEPTESNGLSEAQWHTMSETYMIDFDTISWREDDEKERD